MQERGRFITIEGIEGVGKTTHCQFVVACLQHQGRQIVLTREPGGTRLGEHIRGLLLDRELPPMAPLTELLLIFAARAEHIQRVIRPALTAGQWVVSDRFTDATFAYQGSGRGVARDDIRKLQQLVQQELKPDLTLLLDAPAELALTRTRARGASDRFEQEHIGFFERVRAGYLEAAAAEPQRFRVVDASLDLSGVQTGIRAVLEQSLQ